MNPDIYYLYHKDGYVVEVEKKYVSDIDRHITFLNKESDTVRIASDSEVDEHNEKVAAMLAKAESNVKRVQEAAYVYGDSSYVVPLTGTDANGVSAIVNAFTSGAITETVFFATNGVKVPLDKDTYEMFSNWFWEQRNQQFTTYNKE